MVYLQVSSLTKSFGDQLLFSEISFGVNQGQKIGLIAKNGWGKTTLLHILFGKEEPDSGSIVCRKDLKIGYLQQETQFSDHSDILSHFPAEKQLQAEQILTRLKISDLHQSIEFLSGGQQKRVALAQVLVQEPDLLILDEPTNHLDLKMVEWLEDYLNCSRITLLMVTHDRYFLDKVCNEIIELEDNTIYTYQGNYNYYLTKREERIVGQTKEWERANNLFKKELDWMRRQPQARATKAKSRIDAFYELEKKVQHKKNDSELKLVNRSTYIGKKIFEAKGVSKSFGDIKITENFDYIFSRYEKLGIVGDNGTGKSTFIKMLMGEIQPDVGYFEIGETIRFGYYSQEGICFDENAKVIDVVRNIAEIVEINDRKLTASQFLQHFLFSPEKQYDYVRKLSGGEKRRLYLCTVLIRNPNFLILDEPTNDLDIVTLNVLEEYLIDFPGCVMVVSHDRYFMDKVVDHLLVFEGQGKIRDFPGNYSQYREWSALSEKENVSKVKKNLASQERKKDKPEKRKLSYKEKMELNELDASIPLLESEQKQIESELSSGILSSGELLAKSNRIREVMNELDEKNMRWLELSDV